MDESADLCLSYCFVCLFKNHVPSPHEGFFRTRAGVCCARVREADRAAGEQAHPSAAADPRPPPARAASADDKGRSAAAAAPFLFQ